MILSAARELGFSGIGLSQKSEPPQPPTLHPPRYQTQKGVLELFKKSYYSGSGFQLLLRSHSEVKNSLFLDEGAQGHLYSGAHLHGSHVQSSQSHLGLEHLLMMNLFEFLVYERSIHARFRI